MGSNEEQKLGILTDGFTWRLFHLDREYNLYFEEIIVSDFDSAETMLGYLLFSSMSNCHRIARSPRSWSQTGRRQ